VSRDRTIMLLRGEAPFACACGRGDNDVDLVYVTSRVRRVARLVWLRPESVHLAGEVGGRSSWPAPQRVEPAGGTAGPAVRIR
jgi:hypothetical protein